MIRLAALLVSLLSSLAVAGDDVRARVTGPTGTPALTTEVDPDKSIFGIPLGTSEDAFIRTNGKPMGYARLNRAQTAMLYGRTHAFLFEGGKLMGVRISRTVLDWKRSQFVA